MASTGLDLYVVFGVYSRIKIEKASVEAGVSPIWTGAGKEVNEECSGSILQRPD